MEADFQVAQMLAERQKQEALAEVMLRLQRAFFVSC